MLVAALDPMHMRRLVRQCLESTFKKFKPKTVRAFRAWIAAEGVVKDAAKAIIVAHNHPSGDPMPSDGDVEMTKKLIAAGELLNIPVLDHMIIGMPAFDHSGFFSMAASGLIEF